ncbi:hypothetical protein Lser_V15G08931 [Lactuca serriola]
MATVAMSGASLKATNTIKRKTPSELRDEQLKRKKKVVELMDESPAPEPGFILNANGLTSVAMKASKNPRYIDTRVDELFPSRKNSQRLKMQSVKEHVKENMTTDHTNFSQSEFSSRKDTNASTSTTSTKKFKSTHSHITTKKCSKISMFSSVMELSSVGAKSSGVSLDMDEAFKGLATRNLPIVSPSHTESIDGNYVFHRLMSCGTFHGLGQSNSQVGYQKTNCPTAQISNMKPLYSWVYPQCSLPPSVISALTLLPKGEVCTGQFVAMFTNLNGACNAYVSQSTQSLRSLLKEQVHLIIFIKVEQATTEELFELSEIEKHNLGKTRHTNSLFDVDNSPKSLLMFILPSLNSLDVPLLYSAVPFENAAVSAPEVKCKEVRRMDHMCAPTSDSYYSIELKDAYLPPWIISSVCDAIKLNGDDTFEASFVIEPISIGLNVGLEGVHDETCAYGIGNTVVSHQLNRGFLKGLKYSDKSYVLSLLPV